MDDQQSKERVNEFRDLCRQEGIPFTAQRRTTYEVLLAHDDHPTADQVFDEVRAALPDVSRMTVYRVLDLLVSIGLAKKVCHPGTAVRFDPNLRRHHHLVCLRCNKLIDFQENSLNSLEVPRAALRHGFGVNDYSVQFRGICAECRGKETSTRLTPKSGPASNKRRE